MKKLWQYVKSAFAGWFPYNRYEAATSTNWKSYIPGGLSDSRIDISKWTREEIMRKARYFEKNSAIARRIGTIDADYTVGANGMVFTPSSSDAEWNKRATDYLNKTLSVIDLNTRQTFGSLQQLIAWRTLFDGDCFIVKTRGQDMTGKWWPRIQIIEAHLCSTPPSEQKREGESVIDGVEVDANGRPIAYWFRASSEVEKWRKVDAKDVIVVFDPDRARQTRGLSGFAAAINYLHALDDLQQLELRAIADGAEKSTFIKTQSGELPPAFGSSRLGNGVKTGTTNARSDIGELRTVIGGRTVALGLNEDVTQFTPARPTESTRALWSYLTSCVCAATGIPKMLAFSEWLEGAQGTVVRGDYNIASQMFRAKSGVYAAAFREVIIYVLQWGITSGNSGLSDPPADWTNITTTAPRDVNVDIGRNSQAKINELKVALTSHESEYAALGLDARQEVAKQIRFIAWVKAECAKVSAETGQEVTPAEILGELITAAQPPPQMQPQMSDEDKELAA